MYKKFAFYFLIFTSIIFTTDGFNEQKFFLITSVQAQVNSDVKSSKSVLNVSTEYWKQQWAKASEKRKAPVGENPQGTVVPVELLDSSASLNRQKAKLREMISNGYKQPLDFADLAEKRLKGELVELPMATESYVLDIGGSASETQFTSYNFEDGSVILEPDSPKYLTLKKLADNFDGVKYDLNNAADRRQIKRRLLRMVNPQTKKVIEEIADAYRKKFNRPLRLTSMVRSMEYQNLLSLTNANSFRVSEKGSLPPHTSGCAFDVALKQMTAEEQNFVMKKITEMENKGSLEAVRELGASAVFHVFVYTDGKPPKMDEMEDEDDGDDSD